MTDITPIYKKTMWQRHDMLKSILDATEEMIPYMAPEMVEEVELELAENRLAQKHLRSRAERVEGVRHG